MKIQTLGPGCHKCKKLAEVADEAAKEIGLEFELVKITDISEIMDFGVMTTPALAVDGKLLSAGSVPSIEKVKELLQKAKG